MKTPRDILFQRHQAADVKLDQIRRAVVAQVQPVSPPRHEPLLFRAPLTLWRELILPARFTWAGLAAAWALLLIANAGLSDRRPALSAANDTKPAELWQKYQEEKQLLAELSGRVEPKIIAPTPPFAPRPRSQARNKWETV